MYGIFCLIADKCIITNKLYWGKLPFMTTQPNYIYSCNTLFIMSQLCDTSFCLDNEYMFLILGNCSIAWYVLTIYFTYLYRHSALLHFHGIISTCERIQPFYWCSIMASACILQINITVFFSKVCSYTCLASPVQMQNYI